SRRTSPGMTLENVPIGWTRCRVGKGAQSRDRARTSVDCMRAVPTRFRSGSHSVPTRGHGAADGRLFGSALWPGAFAHPTYDLNRSKSVLENACSAFEWCCTLVALAGFFG